MLSYLSISFTVYEVSASLLLFHVGLLTYRSFKPLPELSTQLSKKLFIGYFTFLLVSTTPILVCMIFSDLFGISASLTFDPNGHCKQLFSIHHSVLVSMLVQLAIHKLFQITVLFLVILYAVKGMMSSALKLVVNIISFKGQLFLLGQLWLGIC